MSDAEKQADDLPAADRQPPPEQDPAADGQPVAGRRGPVWLVLGLAAATLLVCFCSAAVGLAIAWSAGLFHTN